MGKNFLKKVLNLFAVSLVALLPLNSVLGASTVGNNVSIGGTLGVTGATTLTGAATLSSTLSVAGLATLTGGFISASSTVTALTVSSNLSASSTLIVAGAATLSSTLSVSGLTTLTSGFISSASSTVNGNLSVYGQLRASSTLLVTDIATFVSGIRLEDGIEPISNGILEIGGYGLAFGNIFSSSSLFAASSTLFNTGTSTMFLDSSANARGGQIVFKAADGTSCLALYFGAGGVNSNGGTGLGLVTSTITCPR